ncbi:hypothetical protein COLO4_04196 [Corchorus olitorius]|uniref:Uncharacterized protein n=1 Tax=Corchorus olitorius TaxID=93759 RepID=A0A1R3KUY2_9ROSI|nr:hypothetical protein COLO4_04196 [Corchorus olitorius]
MAVAWGFMYLSARAASTIGQVTIEKKAPPQARPGR